MNVASALLPLSVTALAPVGMGSLVAFRPLCLDLMHDMLHILPLLGEKNDRK